MLDIRLDIDVRVPATMPMFGTRAHGKNGTQNGLKTLKNNCLYRCWHTVWHTKTPDFGTRVPNTHRN